MASMKKITLKGLTLLGSAVLMPLGATYAATSTEETLVVSGNTQVSEDPTLPVKGMVATKSLSATKTPTEILKTPQSVSVVTRDQMDAQDASSVSQALRYSSGVFTEYRGSSNRNDEVFVRGFSYVPKFLDGLSYGATASSQTGSLDPWLLERVEIIRGPASVLYGQVNPGGLIAMTSKRPVAEDIHKIQIKAGNHKLAEGAFDLGGVLTDDGRVLYRLNGIGRYQNSQVQDNKETRYAIAPAITWLPNDNTRFTLLTSFQKDPDAGYRNFLPATGTVTDTDAGQIPWDFNVSDRNYNQSWRDQKSIGYEFEHIFNEMFTFRQNARYSEIEQKYKYLVYTTSKSDYVLGRRPQRETRDTNEFVIDNQLQAQFDTAQVAHTILGGMDYKTSKDRQNLWRGSSDGYDIDWRNPVRGVTVDESTMTHSTDEQQTLDQLGLYVQDQMEWNQWNLLLAGRYDWTEVRTDDFQASEQTQQNDSKFTGRAALLYAFDSGISPYISYSTSFEPNLQTNRAPGVAPFAPTNGKQTEIGVKYQPVGSQTLLTVAAYQLRQDNVATYNSAEGWYESAGDIQSRGIETELHSALTESINLIASYTYTDAETKETTVANTKGKTPARIPEHMASLWGSYTFNHGVLQSLTIGVGARYIGTSWGDAQNTYKVPSVDLYDAMVSYDLGQVSHSLNGASVQVNVNNVFDKKYVASCASTSACFYGIGRTASATFNYSF